MNRWKFVPSFSHSRVFLAALLVIITIIGCARDDKSPQDMQPTSCHDIATSATLSQTQSPAKIVADHSTRPVPETDQRMVDGAAAYTAGDFGRAASLWERCAREYADAANIGRQCDALFDLGLAYESLGSYKESAEVLNRAFGLAPCLGDTGREADLLNALGSVYTFTGNDVLAQRRLEQGLHIARDGRDRRAIVRLLNSQGTLLAVRGDYVSAAQVFGRAADEANIDQDTAAIARAMTNRATAMLRAESSQAVVANRTAQDATIKLPDGHEKTSLLITQGRTYWQLSRIIPHDLASANEAAASYLKASKIASAIGDRAMQSFALGYLGEIAESDNSIDKALDLTRRAIFLAQEAHSPDALYRWQWQLARLLRQTKDAPAAVDEYADAIDTLQTIHGDLANGFGNQAFGGSFRESTGPLYYEMADLLLQRADTESDPKTMQADLLHARDTVELLKSGELEDYFHQKCVNLLEPRKIEQEAKNGAAVVYLIPLPDRTEMLVSTSAGLARFKSPVGSTELTAEVRELRDRLEDRTSNRYLINARKLYNWIIRPIEPTLTAQGIDTLIFVPDGALRTVPMAALNDGKEFLVAKYAVAITPGLTLMMGHEDQASSRQNPHARMKQVLEGGLSVSQVAGFAPLDFVPQELGNVHQLFPTGDELLNQTFTAENFRLEMNGHDFTCVHLASHAEFSHNQGDTFLLTYDKKLSLDDLSRLIQTHRFSKEPLELLTLSACQTAAGDDRAALGLAGVAIRMGARSAVATLWSVNDQASADLISRFYTALRDDPQLSKAKAMQRAQLSLLQDVRYRHPCYWAPYLLIGNWL